MNECKKIIITKNIDGLKVGAIGDVYSLSGKLCVKFGGIEFTNNWLKYAIKHGRAKPVIRVGNAK